MLQGRQALDQEQESVFAILAAGDGTKSLLRRTSRMPNPPCPTACLAARPASGGTKEEFT